MGWLKALRLLPSYHSRNVHVDEVRATDSKPTLLYSARIPENKEETEQMGNPGQIIRKEKWLHKP